MSIQIQGVLVCLLGLYALTRPSYYAMIMMIMLVQFGAMAAVNLPAIGGSSILAAHFFLIFFGLRFAAMPGGQRAVLANLAPGKPAFWLMLALAYAIPLTFFAPRLMRGAVEVMTLGGPDTGRLFVLAPLRPSSFNITQSIYALGSLGALLLMQVYLRNAAMYRIFVRAVFALSVLNIFFAVADLATYYVGASNLLDVVKNSNYAIVKDLEKFGLKRIAGAFSEAAAFAGFTTVLFAFNLRLFFMRYEPHRSGPLAAILFLLLIFSTSSTALGALALFFVIVGVFNFWTIGAPQMSRTLVYTMLFGALGFVAFAVAMALTPSLSQVMADAADEFIFNKLESQSGQERSLWNEMAWETFVGSNLLGTGLGSARASNFTMVLLSNIGLVGTLFYTLFLLSLTRSPIRANEPTDPAVVAGVRGAQWGMLAALCAATFASTVFELGLLFYLMAAAASGGMLYAARRPAAQGAVEEPTRRGAPA